MLLYVVLRLAAALPLAPCPSASDLVTHDSQRHLECPAKDIQSFGRLSLRHPGQSSATEERTRWGGCKHKRKCKDAADCGCGKREFDCHEMCKRNCFCSCGGYARGGLNKGLWEECYGRRRCEPTFFKCVERCGEEKDCQAECALEYDMCDCECAQQAYPAAQRKRNWDACLERHQCHNTTCSQCTGAGPSCDKKRWCECAGYHRRDLSGEWEECFHDGTKTCDEARRACEAKCRDGRDRDCWDKCYLDLLDCSCDCFSATEAEWRKWTVCKEKEQCESKTCSGCRKGDKHCTEICRRNCGCRCLGINNADRLDVVSVQQCQIDSGCQATLEKCLDCCGTAKREGCEHECELVSEKCHCECARSRPPKRVEIIQHCNFIY